MLFPQKYYPVKLEGSTVGAPNLPALGTWWYGFAGATFLPSSVPPSLAGLGSAFADRSPQRFGTRAGDSAGAFSSLPAFQGRLSLASGRRARPNAGIYSSWCPDGAQRAGRAPAARPQSNPLLACMGTPGRAAFSLPYRLRPSLVAVGQFPCSVQVRGRAWAGFILAVEPACCGQDRRGRTVVGLDAPIPSPAF